MPSKKAIKLYADVKLSSPSSSTRIIVLSMKNVVKNPYNATTGTNNSYESQSGKKNAETPLIKM